MNRSFSITRRLTLGLVFGVVCFWLGAAMISGLVVRHELNEAFDQSLEQAAIRLLPLAIHDLEELAEGELPENEYEIASLQNYNANFAYYIRNASGKRIALSDDLQADISSSGVPDGFSNIDNVRYFAITDPETGYGIVIAERTNHRSHALWESILALLLPLAALVVADGDGKLEEVIVIDNHALLKSVSGKNGGKRVKRASHEGNVNGTTTRSFPYLDALSGKLSCMA